MAGRNLGTNCWALVCGGGVCAHREDGVGCNGCADRVVLPARVAPDRAPGLGSRRGPVGGAQKRQRLSVWPPVSRALTWGSSGRGSARVRRWRSCRRVRSTCGRRCVGPTGSWLRLSPTVMRCSAIWWPPHHRADQQVMRGCCRDRRGVAGLSDARGGCRFRQTRNSGRLFAASAAPPSWDRPAWCSMT